VVTPGATPRPRPKAKRPKKRRYSNPAASYAKRLERYRPGLVPFVLDGLASIYGHPVWERRQDPTSELILTILTQNSADVNAEVAFEALRTAYPSGLPVQRHVPGVFIFLALMAAMFVHFGAGFAVPRQETFALLAFPPLLAILGPGVNSLLWVPLVLMMVFPGAPLVLLGLWLRNRMDPQEVEDYWF